MGMLEYGLGYRGIVVLNGEIVLPAKSCSLDPTYSLIPDENLHGGTNASNKYAAIDIAYAEGTITCAGNVTFSLYENIWSYLKDWVYSDRASIRTIDYCPDGVNWQHYGSVKVGKIDFSCTEVQGAPGSLINVNLDVVGALFSTTPTSGADSLTMAVTDPTGADATRALDKHPIPFWKTYVTGDFCDINTTNVKLKVAGASAGGTGASRIRPALSWTVSINNNPTTTFALTANRYPEFVTQGKMDITGNFVLFDPIEGVPLPTSNYYSDNFVITMGSKTLSLQRVVLESFPVTNSGANTRVTRQYSWKAFGKDQTGDFLEFSV